jgi:hypothetical protein
MSVKNKKVTTGSLYHAFPIRGKRGDITSAQIIGIIILLVSLAIIIYVYYQINWTGQVDDTVCHESVVLRGTISNMADVNQVTNIVPLKCKTEKICVGGTGMFNKGECSEYEGAKDVSVIKADEINDVNRLFAQEMVSCWKMMGEGKLSLFSRGVVDGVTGGGVYAGCVICSRVAFDEKSLKNSGVDLKELNVDNYMRSYKMEGANGSYFDVLAGEDGKVMIKSDLESVTIPQNLEDGKPIGTTESVEVVQASETPTDSYNKEAAIIFMQVSAPSYGSTLKNSVAFLGLGWGGSFVANPIKTLKMTATAVKSAPFLLAVVGLIGVQQTNVWANRNVAAGYCGDVSFGDNAREGCSVVRLVDYNLEDISKYCGVIESVS